MQSAQVSRRGARIAKTCEMSAQVSPSQLVPGPCHAEGRGFESHHPLRTDNELDDYTPARAYDAARDTLSQEAWLGSFMKFTGGYLDDPGLNAEEETRVLDRVAELLNEEKGR